MPTAVRELFGNFIYCAPADREIYWAVEGITKLNDNLESHWCMICMLLPIPPVPLWTFRPTATPQNPTSHCCTIERKWSTLQTSKPQLVAASEGILDAFALCKRHRRREERKCRRAPHLVEVLPSPAG